MESGPCSVMCFSDGEELIKQAPAMAEKSGCVASWGVNGII